MVKMPSRLLSMTKFAIELVVCVVTRWHKLSVTQGADVSCQAHAAAPADMSASGRYTVCGVDMYGHDVHVHHDTRTLSSFCYCHVNTGSGNV